MDENHLQSEEEVQKYEKADIIFTTEVGRVLKDFNNRNAIERDTINAEMLKSARGKILDRLFNFQCFITSELLVIKNYSANKGKE